MDRGTIILAVGFTVMVGLYSLNMTRSDVGMKDSGDSYASKRQARQIAVAGVSLAMNELRYNSNWSAGFQNRSVLGGTLNLTVSTSGLPAGQKRLTSTGKYFDSTYTAITVVQVPPEDRNLNMALLNVQSLIEMQGTSLTITPSNKFTVNGNNWIADTTYDPATAKYGIGASSSTLNTSIVNALTNAGATNKVTGVGSPPSVTTLASVVNMTTQEREIKRIATITHRNSTLGREKYWGTMTAPEIVFVTKSLTVEKPLTGAGILCVDGNLTVRSTMSWKGYVIVRGNTFNVQSTGIVDIKGAIFFGNNGGLRFGSAGTMAITYSSNILQELETRLFVSARSKPVVLRTYE